MWNNFILSCLYKYETYKKFSASLFYDWSVDVVVDIEPVLYVYSGTYMYYATVKKRDVSILPDTANVLTEQLKIASPCKD